MYLKTVISKLKELPNMYHGVEGINAHRTDGCYTMELSQSGVHSLYEVFRGDEVREEEIPKTTHGLAELLEELIEEGWCLEGYKGGMYEVYDSQDVVLTGYWGMDGEGIMVEKIDENGIHAETISIEFKGKVQDD